MTFTYAFFIYRPLDGILKTSKEGFETLVGLWSTMFEEKSVNKHAQLLKEYHEKFFSELIDDTKFKECNLRNALDSKK